MVGADHLTADPPSWTMALLLFKRFKLEDSEVRWEYFTLYKYLQPQKDPGDQESPRLGSKAQGRRTSMASLAETAPHSPWPSSGRRSRTVAELQSPQSRLPNCPTDGRRCPNQPLHRAILTGLDLDGHRTIAGLAASSYPFAFISSPVEPRPKSFGRGPKIPISIVVPAADSQAPRF